MKPAARPLPTKAPTEKELIAEHFKDVPREFQEQMPPGRTPLGGLPFLPGPKGAIRKGQQTLLPPKDIKFQKRVLKPPPKKLGLPKEGEPLRVPSEAEVAGRKLTASKARSEVAKFAGQKFPRKEGWVEEPSRWTRIKRGRVFQALTRGSVTPETTLEQFAGKGSTTYKATADTLREGEHQAGARYYAGHDQVRAFNKKRGITPKHITASESKGALWLGGKRKIPPGVVADIYATAMDPDGRRALTKDGVTFVNNRKRWRIPPADVARLRSEFKSRFPKDAAFTEWVFQFVNQVFGPEIQKAAWQETGFKMNLKRNYWQMVRDSTYLRRQRAWLTTPEAQHQRAMTEMFEGMGGRAAAHARLSTVAKQQSLRGGTPEPTGFAYSRRGRIGGSAPILMTGIYTKFFNLLNQMAHYSGKAVPLRDARHVLSAIDPLVRDAFPDGDIRMKVMYDHLRAYEGRDIPPPGDVESIAGGMLRRGMKGILGFRLQTGAIQPISYLNALTEIPAKHLFSRETLFGSGKQSMAEIKNWVPTLRARFEGIGRMFMTPTFAPTVKEQVRLFYGGKRPLPERVGLWHIRAGDRMTMIRLWRASKSLAMEQGFKGDEMFTEARKIVMRTTDRTQPSSRPMSLARLQMQARASPMTKAAVFLTNVANKQVNIALRAI
ncbi:MAG: hypothetical protein ACYSU0_22130, partial [Planctomycetota bacterium]